MNGNCKKVLIGLMALAINQGCSKSSSSSSAPSAAAPVTNLTVSGTVISSTTTSAFSLRSGMGSKAAVAPGRNAKFGANSCIASPWSAAYVGGGGAVIASGTADSAGDFTVPAVPKGKEAIIKFTGDGCSQRCLVKSGDAGVYCNPVADAVVGAFESALGKLITDASFAGASLSKLGGAIVQASEGDSSATQAFLAAITDCHAAAAAAQPACYKDAIASSPFMGQFKMMQAMATGWTPEAIYTYIVDAAGLKISIDNFIYTDFGTKMDAWLSTDFVVKTKEFIAAVIADQIANGNAYAIKLTCRMGYQKTNSGGEFTYAPILDGSSVPTCQNTTAWTANGIDASYHAAIITAMASNSGGNAVQLGAGACNSSFGTANVFCVYPPEMQMVSKFTETDRNDPDGTMNKNTGDNFHVSMVDIFPEMDATLQNLANLNPPESDCATGGSNGPPVIKATAACNAWFGAIMLQNKGNFAGVMGLYFYLKDTTAYKAGKLSLANLHKILVGTTFLNTRFEAWAPFYSGANLNNIWYSPLIAYDAPADIFKMQDIFLMGAATPTQGQLDAAVAASIPPYKYTFKMFENIPTAEGIRQFIFGSGHHEEWNPSGTKYYYASGVQQTGKPILCKMTNVDTGKPTESELITGKTSIECMTDYTAVTVAADGTLTGASSAYPYTLVGRGWNGDTEGMLYSLADRRTGFPVRTSSGEIMVKEYRSGASVCSTVGEKNTVVQAIMKMGSGTNTQEASFKAYCLDMAAYTNSGLYSFYDGGDVEIKQKSFDGTVSTWRARQAGSRATSGADQTTLSPVCLFSSDLSVNTATNLVTATAGTIASGYLTVLGAGGVSVFDVCDATTHSSLTKYYLILMGGSQNATHDNMYVMVLNSTTNNFQQVTAWSQNAMFEDVMLKVKPPVIESTLTSRIVAPASAPVFTSNVKLLNSKYNAKFDPYCDDVNGNGFCDCYDGATYVAADSATWTLKADPSQCTLMDFAAEPTMSAPYCANCNGADKMKAFFAAMGGKAGTDLHTVPAITYGSTPTTIGASGTFDGNYVNTNQLYFNFDDAAQCQYKKTGESNYRKPDYIRWDGFWKNHSGCPDSAGTITALTNPGGAEAGGGPIRLVKPKEMKNAYDVARPNTLMKLIGFATKSVGTGVTLATTDKVFAFDEAMAMISLRSQMPLGIQVYNSAGNSVVPGANPQLQSVRTPNGHDMAPPSAILRALSHPTEL